MPSPSRKAARAVRVPKIVHAGESGLFFALLKREGLPMPHTEFVFAAPRKWRFDFAFTTNGRIAAYDLADNNAPIYVSVKVALEVEGGVWTLGRHTRGKGFLNDCEKYNEAACLGWRLLRVTPQQLCTLETIALIKRALTA